MLTPDEVERGASRPPPSGSDNEVAVRQLGQGELIWFRFRKHKLAMIGSIILALLVIMAVFAPIISPEVYLHWNYLDGNVAPRFAWPGTAGWKYLLGTDGTGHSLVMWIAYGARVSLAVGIFAALLTTIVGIVLGGMAGFFGGWTDTIIMRSTDIVLTLPFLPLVILLSYYVSGGSWVLIILIFAAFGWPSIARLVRSYALTLRRQEFSEAARAVGVSNHRIIFRYILPNAMSPIIVAATLSVADYIISEAAIDFLGVGVQPPTVSWGLALSNAQDSFLVGNWWWAFFPGMFILITVLAVNFLGDGLRDALDIRSHGL
ncbi:MAG: ABC transporter permease [Chloroflexota bacterium]